MKSKKNLRKHTKKVKKKYNKQKKYRKNYSRKRQNKTIRNTKSKIIRGGGFSVIGTKKKLVPRTMQSPVLPSHIKYGFFEKFRDINFEEIYDDEPPLDLPVDRENNEALIARPIDDLKVILALYANPHFPGHPPLVINKEINILFNKLQQNLKLDALFTGLSLESNCKIFNPQIILYSGHIVPTREGLQLFLHNETNLRRGKLFKIEVFIEELFKNTNLKLVILLACHSYDILEYLERRDQTNDKCKPCFITFNGPALDDAMVSFLDGCSDIIKNKYESDDTIDPKKIYDSGIDKFTEQEYKIGNPSTEGDTVHADPKLIESY